MNFLIKRYMYGMIKRMNWLSLTLIIPIAYLLVMSYKTDRFTVWQSLSIPQNAPVALVSSPMGHQFLGDVIDNPEGFFRNNYIVTILLQDTFGSASMAWSGDQAAKLIESVRNNMSLSISGNGRPQIQYDGKDKKTGELLVGFYANRLLRQSMEGYVRIGADNGSSLSIYGSLETIGHRALWRQDRLVPLMSITLLSIAGVLMLLGILEWSDQSLKSERQIGRYLNLPVLGSMPDLDKVSHKMAPSLPLTDFKKPRPIENV